MKCEDMVKELEKLCRPSYALDWDNVGLLAGSKEKEVKKILVSLDCDNAAVETAVSIGADMIITHHPIIFSKVGRVTDDNIVTARIIKMIENGICGYSMHTNFDATVMAKLAAEYLGISETKPLEIVGTDCERGESPAGCGDENAGDFLGIGSIGIPDCIENVEYWCEKVKQVFDIPNVILYGDEKAVVRKVAVCPGSGKEYIPLVRAMGANLFITGDINHHAGLDAIDMGINVMDASHYGIEYIFVDYISKYIKECFGNSVEVVKMPKSMPFKIY